LRTTNSPLRQNEDDEFPFASELINDHSWSRGLTSSPFASTRTIEQKKEFRQEKTREGSNSIPGYTKVKKRALNESGAIH